jgi:hypothetical protein
MVVGQNNLQVAVVVVAVVVVAVVVLHKTQKPHQLIDHIRHTNK